MLFGKGIYFQRLIIVLEMDGQVLFKIDSATKNIAAGVNARNG